MKYRLCLPALLLSALPALLVPLSVPRAAAAAGTTLSGWLNVTWACGEARPGSEVEYSLTPDQGAPIPLRLDPKLLAPLGGVTAIRGQRLVIEGDAAPTPQAAGAAPGAVTVQSVRKDETAAGFVPLPDPATGNKRYITLLLRFADKANVTPKPLSYFQALMGGDTPEVGQFYHTLSYGQLDIQGSRAAGWFTLPKPRSGYAGGTAGLDLDKVLADAMQLTQKEVFFPDFYGINLVFNVNPFSSNFVGMGGWRYLKDVQGTTRLYGTTWIGEVQQCVLAHEMGHTLGLPHSSGPYAATYDSHWDVMSYPYSTPNATYGDVAQGTIAFHRDILGWIPADRKYRAAPGTQATLTLSPLDAAAPSGSSYGMAQIPLGVSGKRFYTVEARRRTGYDANLPGAGVVLHLVDLARDTRVAQVVDPDGNGNPNDAGALWLPGETFTDAANAVQLQVLHSTAGAVTITITTGVLPPAGLQARAVSQTQVQLSWKNAGSGIQKIAVERRSGGSAYETLATLTPSSTAFTDASCSPKTTYTYRLHVTNAASVSTDSADATVTTLGGAGGKLRVASRLRFGTVAVGRSRVLSLSVQNLSRTEKLQIEIAAPYAPFGMAADVSAVIPALGRRSVRVTFKPSGAGPARGSLALQSSDPAHPSVKVALLGTGK